MNRYGKEQWLPYKGARPQGLWLESVDSALWHTSSHHLLTTA